MSEAAPKSSNVVSSSRLVEVDALRGIAAVAVVLFHFTTRFEQLFKPEALPAFSVPWGHLGVNLFFIISGFVIFMTLERTRVPMDFVVSRFSRLFPAYWAAILITFVVTHAFGLPQKLVSLQTALANFSMLHGLVGITHVDGVYWTLEIELLFYFGMFALYRTGHIAKIHWAARAMLLLRLAYFCTQHWLGFDLIPWKLYHLMIVEYLPWFILGISVYIHIHPKDEHAQRQALLTAVAAVCSLFVAEGPGIGLLAFVLAALVWMAAAGRLSLLRLKLLSWLGAISYPLYLLHENIGWSVMLQLHAAGIEANLALALSLILVLALAQALHKWVEMPVMNAIRVGWRQRQFKS